MGLILRLALLERSLGAIVILLHVQVGGSGSEEDVQWNKTGADLNGGTLGGSRGWDISELNVVGGLDSGGNDLASSACTTTESTSTSATAGATSTSAAAISARSVSSHAGNQSRDDHKLW